MPAVNPAVTTYASRSPYITAQEYLDSPTAVDTSTLVVGQPAAESAQLIVTIARASSLADTFCQQVLAATQDIQAGRYAIRHRDGIVRVPLDRTPILEVNAVTWGWTPSGMVALTDLSNVWIGKKVVDIPLFGTTNPYPSSPPWSSWA